MSQKLSENNNKADAFSISQLSRQIKKSLEAQFPENFWVVGEISEIRMHSSGHVYLELIEKDPKSDHIKARIKATIWSFTYRMLRPYFEGSTGYSIEAGLKIMVSSKIEYHPQYGLSLNILDIDPNYTLGDLARKKAEIVERLVTEGVIDMNKSIPFPLVPQRIAVISSESAAGYGDFLDSLETNIYGFHFNLTLFPSIMQGEKAARSIINSLENIFKREEHFDIVVIIRGGGAKTDLECFNDYELALNLCQFPIPLITGIGHERDDTVCDMVAHQKLKTPTAVAEFIIDRVADFQDKLLEFQNAVSQIVEREINQNQKLISGYLSQMLFYSTSILTKGNSHIESLGYRLKNMTDRLLDRSNTDLKTKKSLLEFHAFSFTKNNMTMVHNQFENIRNFSRNYLDTEKSKLEAFQNTKKLLDPVNVLNRGYSVTYHNGRLLKSAKGLKIGDTVISLLSKGKIKSKITK